MECQINENLDVCTTVRSGLHQSESQKIHTTIASCQKGPTRHADAWQIGLFWQDTLDNWGPSQLERRSYQVWQFPC